VIRYFLFLTILVLNAVTASAMNPKRLCFKISEDDKVCFFKLKDGATYQLDIESLYLLGNKPLFLDLASVLVVSQSPDDFEETEYVSIEFEFRLNKFRQTVDDPNDLYEEMTIIIEQIHGEPKLRADFSKHNLDIDAIFRKIKEERGI